MKNQMSAMLNLDKRSMKKKKVKYPYIFLSAPIYILFFYSITSSYRSEGTSLSMRCATEF